MIFEWDETKNAANYRKHLVLFETAVLAFEDSDCLMVQDREVDGEERWQSMGRVDGTLMLLVAHLVEDSDEDELVRIISARRVSAHERRRYEDRQDRH